MRYYISIIGMLFLFCGITWAANPESTSQTAEDDMDIYDLVMHRIQEKQKSSVNLATVEANTDTYLTMLDATNKYFTDINYSAQDQTNWFPITHLDRVKQIVFAYTMEGSKYYGDETIYTRINDMMQYWYDVDPRSTNAYMQQMGCPLRVGMLMILMRSGNKTLTTTLENLLIARMVSIGGDPAQSGSFGTGANKTEIATHWVYRGCLTKNKTVFEKGVTQAFMPLELTTGEGFQHDDSYMQHGPQLYIGGYGNVIAQAVCNLAQYLVGTNYALADDKFDLLSGFLRKTYLRAIRGKYYLFNSAGRSLSRPNGSSQSFASVLEDVKAVDSANAEEYEAAIKRLTGKEPASYGLVPYHAHHWRSDYTLHQRPGYTIDVRMVSTKTYRNENGNGENIRGYFLSDGATDIALDGDEYVNLFPVWDWGRIPGTTTPALATTSIPQPAQWGTYGSSTFVGGVSDGTYGVSAYSLTDYTYASINTEAKKSWFFFDDEVVCLGTGIKSTAATQINTTLNQCHLVGDITLIKKDETKEVVPATTKGNTNYDNNLSWAIHNNVGYYLPEGGNIQLSNQTQTGSWYLINTSQSSTSISKDVFKMWFNHGVKPTNDSYVYYIVPNMTADKVADYDTDNIEIISNTESIQAVKHKGLDIIGIVFYGPATFTYGDNVSIKAARPCVVMVHNIDQPEVKIHIADPARSFASISLILDLPGIENTKELVCTLPTETAYAGSSREFVVNAETQDYIPVEDTNTYLEASADAYVYGGSKATNYGSDPQLVVKTDSEAYTREVFLKFNAKDIDFKNIESLHLRLVAVEGDADYLNNTMRIWACSSLWTEVSVNWNNKPAISGSVIATAPAVTVGEDLLFNVKDYILSEVAKDNTVFSFKLGNTYTGNVSKTRISFHSRESIYESLRPALVIKYADDVALDKIENSDILIYPNPATSGDIIQIVSPGEQSNCELSVTDLAGRIWIKTTGNKIDANNLIPGIYIVSVINKDNSKSENKKLIIR